MPIANYDYHGFPIWYRTENRSTGPTLILSFRGIPNTSTAIPQKIIFEDSPQTITKELAAGKSLDEIVESKAPDFLCKLFPADPTGLPPERNRDHYSLPLAVVIELNWDAMCKANAWSEETTQEYRRHYDLMMKKWGSIPFSDAIPALLAPSLESLSHSKHKRIIRAFNALWIHEILARRSTNNPWDGYTAKSRRSSLSHKKLINRNLSRNVLSRNQRESIIALCFNNLHDRINGGYWIASLLLMTTGVTLNEVCALNFSDFSPLKHYIWTHTLSIFYIVRKKDSRYFRQNIDNPYKARILPLSTAVSEAIKIYIGTASTSPNFDDSFPLVPSPKNYHRRATPDHLKKWIENNLSNIIFPANNIAPIPTSTPAHQILTNTARALLDQCGYEPEEYNYQVGLAPQLTAGKSYADFCHEAALNKMRGMQDRLIASPTRTNGTASTGTTIFTRKDASCFWSPKAGQRLDLDITIKFPPLAPDNVPKSGLTFVLSATHGADITAQFT